MQMTPSTLLNRHHHQAAVVIADEPEWENDVVACAQLGQHGVKDLGRTWKILFDTRKTWESLWGAPVRHGVKDLANTRVNTRPSRERLLKHCGAHPSVRGMIWSTP